MRVPRHSFQVSTGPGVVALLAAVPRYHLDRRRAVPRDDIGQDAATGIVSGSHRTGDANDQGALLVQRKAVPSRTFQVQAW